MEEIPFEDRLVPKAEIDWDRSCWWLYPLSRAIHPALRVSALALSAVSVAVIQLGLYVGNWLLAPRFAPEFENFYLRSFGSVPLAPIEVGQSQLFLVLGLRELAYLTFCLLWLTLVLGFFGGILSRRAAIELGQRTIAPWGETVRVVGNRLVSYLWVTGMQLVAITLLLVIPFLLGLLARLGPMAVVAGILLILFFPAVVVLGRIILSMFICYPLAVTAISCERNADAFEGFSRSNNYFFQRPVLATLCFFALLGVGFVGYFIAFWILMAGWHWMRDAFLTGAGYTVLELIERPVTDSTSTVVVDNMSRGPRILQWVLIGGWLTRLLIASYWFSYFWSGAAALYLVLRRSVDNTDLDEIDGSSTGQVVSLPEIPAPPIASDKTPDKIDAAAGDATGGPAASPISPA